MAETRPISSRRIWLARGIAMAADALQIAVFPYFFEGVLSPVNALLDVVVMVAMVLLVGWHIAFVPTFLVEQLPFADLAPTWTVAVWIVTKGKMTR